MLGAVVLASKPVPAEAREERATNQSAATYTRVQIDLGAGAGLRLNNPFRLQTPLGSTPRSLSASAPYADLRALSLWGDPFAWHYGFALSFAAALQGISQQVITPALAVSRPLTDALWVQGYAGAPIVLSPDANVGLEAGVELSYWVRSGWGLYAGLVGDQYWGAATDQSWAVSIPIVAAQAGLCLQYERLQ
jgi:hypothetical protein